MPAENPAKPYQAVAEGGRCSAAIARPERAAIVAFLATFAILQGFLLLRYNVNWDEFHFLAQVHAFADDRLWQSMQTFHVHLFGWLLLLPLTEVSQVVAGRVVMGLAHCVSAVCLFLVARRLFSGRDAWLILVAYLASGYVLGHALSFRTDPLATALMMSSLAIMFCASLRWRSALAAAVLAAMALLVTVKSVFYLPAFLAALIFRLSNGKTGPVMRHFAATGALLVVFGLLGLYVHSASLPVTGESKPAADAAISFFDKTVLSQSWFPRWNVISVWIMRNPPAAIVAIAGLAASLAAALSGRRIGVVCLLLAAPLVTLTFYRNAFPYFFAFIMPPVFLGSGIVLRQVRSSAIRAALIAAMGIALLAQFKILAVQDQSAQRTVIAEVHRLFPEPVPYIDRNGMVPSFPKVGFFMTGWGMEAALATGRPVLAPVIERDQPVFVIANSPALQSALEPGSAADYYRLHPEDQAKLRNSYIHQWGPIWIAGHRMRADGTAQRFENAVAGEYTLECGKADVVLDGRAASCGSQIELSSGPHILEASPAAVVTFRWGRGMTAHQNPPPGKPIYYGL